MIVKVKNGNSVLLEFKDTVNNKGDLETFTRELKNQEYNFINGNLVTKILNRVVAFLKSIRPSITLSEDFITMDLETKEINGVLMPYCVSIYDRESKTSFFLLDYKSSELMLEDSIKHLMRRKYDDCKIYLHNFSYFDGIFLIRILSNLSDNINPIIRDGRIIDIRFTHRIEDSKSKYNLYFRDSCLMLPASLRSLAKNFGVEEKGIFPFRFVNNKNIGLDYSGKLPRTNFFDLTKDNISDFINYRKQFTYKPWNLREEAIRYCEQDCVTLHQVISKFSYKIFDKFRVDIHKYPTMSSLTFGNFRTNFLDDKEHKIPLIHGEIYDFIKRSYKGGATEAYIPFGKDIKGYDVNSLYPTAMKTFDMPTGEPVYFEGDILKTDSSAFGFFEAKVNAPTDLNIPVLQTRLKTNNSIKTITPVGT
jgi:DNA polymerase type B, organellar and viral